MQKSDYILYPYWNVETESFGLRDSFVARLYREIVNDGNKDVVFYNGVIKNEIEWVRYCQREDVCLFVLLRINDFVPVCAIWLDFFNDKTAHYNYACFKFGVPKYADLIKLGKKTVQEILHKKNGDEYVLDTLIGFAPVFNRKSTLFALHCGGKLIGTLPLGAWVEKKNKSEPCHIISFERAEE